jgi:hypothetical protein
LEAPCQIQTEVPDYVLRQIENRPADEVKDVGSGDFLLQRFTQFVAQSRILVGSGRLPQRS